jgi:hypothetical protein
VGVGVGVDVGVAVTTGHTGVGVEHTSAASERGAVFVVAQAARNIRRIKNNLFILPL